MHLALREKRVKSGKGQRVVFDAFSLPERLKSCCCCCCCLLYLQIATEEEKDGRTGSIGSARAINIDRACQMHTLVIHTLTYFPYLCLHLPLRLLVRVHKDHCLAMAPSMGPKTGAWDLVAADDPTDWRGDFAFLRSMDASLRCDLCYVSKRNRWTDAVRVCDVHGDAEAESRFFAIGYLYCASLDQGLRPYLLFGVHSERD